MNSPRKFEGRTAEPLFVFVHHKFPLLLLCCCWFCCCIKHRHKTKTQRIDTHYYRCTQGARKTQTSLNQSPARCNRLRAFQRNTTPPPCMRRARQHIICGLPAPFVRGIILEEGLPCSPSRASVILNVNPEKKPWHHFQFAPTPHALFLP